VGVFGVLRTPNTPTHPFDHTNYQRAFIFGTLRVSSLIRGKEVELLQRPSETGSKYSKKFDFSSIFEKIPLRVFFAELLR